MLNSTVPWLSGLYVLVGAVAAFGFNYALRCLDLRRRRIAFRVQTRAALDLLRSTVNGGSFASSPEATETLTARLSDLLFTVDATLCFKDAALFTACRLPMMVWQTQLLAARRKELVTGLAIAQDDIKRMTERATIYGRPDFVDANARLEAKRATLATDVEESETKMVAMLSGITSTIDAIVAALR